MLKKTEHDLSFKDEEMKQKSHSYPNKTASVARKKKIVRLCGDLQRERVCDLDVAECLDDARQYLKVINYKDAKTDFFWITQVVKLKMK